MNRIYFSLFFFSFFKWFIERKRSRAHELSRVLQTDYQEGERNRTSIYDEIILRSQTQSECLNRVNSTKGPGVVNQVGNGLRLLLQNSLTTSFYCFWPLNFSHKALIGPLVMIENTCSWNQNIEFILVRIYIRKNEWQNYEMALFAFLL